MGMHRIAVLEVEVSPFPVSECGLWCRDGLDGAEVWIGDKRISLPREALVALIAMEYRSRQICTLEQMTDADVMAELFGETRG